MAEETEFSSNAHSNGDPSEGGVALRRRAFVGPQPDGPSASPSGCREGFRFEDHAADIAIHGWGDLLPDAIEQAVLGMLEYMCPRLQEQVRLEEARVLEATAHDLHSLVFAIFNDTLYAFGRDGFIAGDIRIGVLEIDGKSPTGAATEAARNRPASAEQTELHLAPAAPSNRFFARWGLRGEHWRPGHHRPGTEVKAITMHDLDVALSEEDDRWHVHVVVDI